MKLKSLILIVVLVAVVVLQPHLLQLGLFGLGAVLTGGLLGTSKGKIAGIVTSTWKGINTAREYVIPSNPHTVAQTSQRDRFSAIQSFASSLLATVISTYWNPFAVRMSGYNYFIQQNIKLLANTTFYLTVNNLMTKGTLESVKTVAGTLAAGVVTATWSKSIVGNGLVTDSITSFVVNKETFAVYVEEGADTRDDETSTITCTGETDASKLLVFISCSRGTGSSFVVSNSVAAQVTA